MANQIVSSGQSLQNGTIVSSGDSLTVLAGGEVFGVDARSNSLVIDSGTVADVSLGSGSQLLVAPGAFVEVASGKSPNVANGAEIVVSSGGTLSSFSLTQTLMIVAGAAAGVTVETGGSVIDYGSFDDGDIAGGSATVSSGASATSNTVEGSGVFIVAGGGTASGTRVMNVGTELVSGAEAKELRTTLSGGTLTVAAGGTASALANAGSTIDVQDGGFVFPSVISATVTVRAGGTVSNATFSSSMETLFGTDLDGVFGDGGLQDVKPGGLAQNTTVSGAGVIQFVSGSASSADVLVGAEQFIFSGGQASDTAVVSGLQLVMDGGSAFSNIIGLGGSGLVRGLTSDTRIIGGGNVTVSSGGEAVAVLVSSGVLDVLSQGTSLDSVVYAGGSEILRLGGALIQTDLTHGGQLDVAFLPYQAGGSASVAGDDTLTITEGSQSFTTKLIGNYLGTTFALTPDITGGTSLSASVACYCAGTLILTDRGEVAVEDLQVGDLLVTRSGAARPLRWIGRRSYNGRFLVSRPETRPIRFTAGALGEGLPRRDLFVSANHALYLSGILIPARDLVNGSTILQVGAVKSVRYFHLELETHDIIFAEGAASETLLDDDSRNLFHNAHDYEKPYPARRGAPAYCAPRLSQGFAVEAVRRDLARIAALRAA